LIDLLQLLLNHGSVFSNILYVLRLLSDLAVHLLGDV
jgi:hypothetical protein